ncbi:hypothetical protein G153_09608 [Megasphaera sp. BL7]|uniref:putative phage tail protein n=1 Tax=unclassified Megasphaera TaxID=2626256 RepID=UPI000358333F|nr:MULTISPECIES: putative phage tail protein [unclassified Megasphaera]EPP15558.1 hypothetical protein G153_09608 [Megasphaera sp. BL7]EPP18917.1 hypothetical protein NM10_00994 [Megasphaera sp. NM10]
MADAPDFQLLRNTKVDLSRYLPAFLFRDTAFGDALNTLSYEHELQRLTLAGAAKQAFVQTATWGLDDWEEFVGLEHAQADTVQTRRNKILMKLAGTESVTVSSLEVLINQYILDKSGTVTDHPETYSADFNIPLVDKMSLLSIAKDVRTYIPAHIGQVYKTHADTNVENHIAMLKSTVKTIDVYPVAVEKIAPESGFYVAMAMTTTERLTLYIGGI